MSLIGDYKNALQALYDHVGFKEDWVVYAIEDRTEMFWKISGTERDGEVIYHEDNQVVHDEDGQHYSDEIYTQRFYSKWVYRGTELTMIFVDTHTDGNKFFAVYSNEKELR